MKRPAFQFYPGDWLRSTDLRSCSVGARGLWIEMICLMHEGNPYGHLKVGGKDILTPILAQMVGAPPSEVEGWLSELRLAGVFSESQRSRTIYSRRMVRDERVRESRANGGIKSLENPNVPRPRISLPPSLPPSPAFASASASAIQSRAVPLNNESSAAKTWWKTNEGIDEKAKSIGLKPERGEDYPTFKDRIFQEIARRRQAGSQGQQEH